MKNLKEFVNFDWNRFAEGKRFIAINTSPWLDYQTHNRLGTKVEIVIIEDNTKYSPRPDGTFTNNAFEKIQAKITKSDLSIPLNTPIVLHGVKASVYGDYYNLLSVTADNVTVSQSK